MIVSLLCLLTAAHPQAPVPDAVTYVVSIVSETTGDDVSLRFVLSGTPNSYSAVREGDDIVVRIAAEPLPGLSLPQSRSPIGSLLQRTDEGVFSLRVSLSENRTHEIVRELSSLRLVLHPSTASAAMASPDAVAPPPTPAPAEAEAGAAPSPTPQGRIRSGDPIPADTAELYRRLFPATSDPAGPVDAGADIRAQEDWYSDFTWFGIQARPWVSVSYVDGRTTQVQANTVNSDSYWVIQPNLGLGFSPTFGPREGQWSINYTPRFRRQLNLNLPRLASHFFDIGLDQPVAAFGSLYGNYHFSKGVLETDEIDPGREYGIGLNRVVDTSLERFRRHTLGFGLRVDFVADSQIDVNVNKTRVRYGNDPGEEIFVFGERAFFDYDTRTLNASVRRGLGESRFLRLLFGLHDTPEQVERKQVQGRGYSYGAALEGEIAALTQGRIMLGYRTQKNPEAGEGGRDYKDLAYGARLLREFSEDTSAGVGADRNLYLSAYRDNGFYIADTLHGDLNTRIPLSVFLRGTVGLQTSNYRTSPQVSDTGGSPLLRRDKIRFWSVGANRRIRNWAFLRVDYTSERRDSNLDRFDINTRSLTFQLGLGFFGRPGAGARPVW